MLSLQALITVSVCCHPPSMPFHFCECHFEVPSRSLICAMLLLKQLLVLALWMAVCYGLTYFSPLNLYFFCKMESAMSIEVLVLTIKALVCICCVYRPIKNKEVTLHKEENNWLDITIKCLLTYSSHYKIYCGLSGENHLPCVRLHWW